MARPKGSKDPTPSIERAVEIACKRISVKGTQYLENLIDAAMDPNLPAEKKPELRWVLMAIKEVMDRGLGKPKVTIDQNISTNADELIEAIRQGKERVATKAIDTGTTVAQETLKH